MKVFPITLENIPLRKSYQEIMEFFDAPSADDLTDIDFIQKGSSSCTAIFLLSNADIAYDFLNMPNTVMDGQDITICPEFFDEMSLTINKSWLQEMENLCPGLLEEMEEVSKDFDLTFQNDNGVVTLSGNTWRVQKMKEHLQEHFHLIVKTQSSKERRFTGAPSPRLRLSKVDNYRQRLLPTRTAADDKPKKRQRRLLPGAGTSPTDPQQVSTAGGDGGVPAKSHEIGNSTGQTVKMPRALRADDQGPRDGAVARRRVLVPQQEVTASSLLYVTSIMTTAAASSFLKEHSRLLDFRDCSVSQIPVSECQTKWVFECNNEADLKRIEEDFNRLVSKIKTKCCRVPDELDFDVFKSLVSTNNKNEDVTLSFNHPERTCSVVGMGNVSQTYQWVEDCLKQKSFAHGKSDASLMHDFEAGTRNCNFPTTSKAQTYSSGAINKPMSPKDHRYPSAIAKGFSVRHTSRDRISFSTPGGLTVHVYQGDMTKQRTSAIVNPANCHLSHAGGLARAIVMAGGSSIDAECQAILSTKAGKRLETGEVVHTSAGMLAHPIEYIIHAVGPIGSVFQGNDAGLISMMRKTFLNCFNCADHQLLVSSISVPPISAGLFGVPMEFIIRGAFEAIREFDSVTRSSLKLQEIHFISNDSKTTEDMAEKFFACLNTR